MVGRSDATDRWAEVLGAAPVGIAVQDAGLRYTWAPLGGDPLGAARDPVGCTDDDVYPSGAADRLTALKREVLASGEGLRSDLVVERDGRRRDFDVTLTPLPGSAGVATVAVDVTERRRVQADVERSLARLAEAEHVAHIGSWEWDIAENVVSWSDGLYEIYGIDRAAFDPRYRPGADRVHPEDRARVDASVRDALETCEPIDIEYRILRPDGRVRRVRGRAEVIVGADGRPARLAGTAQDVTEHRAPTVGGRQLAAILTPRQLEILALVAEGLTNAEIADRLFLSESTVKWHVRKILRALGLGNRAQAVARYLAR